MTKVYVATPAYDGKVNVQYAISLAETQTFLASLGIPVQVSINCSGSLLVAERNRLIMSFLESDCTHMLCIDSDLGWPATAVKAMLEKDENFICGVYPTRRDNLFLFRPCLNEDKSIVDNKAKSLLKMEYVSAGFMLLKRQMLEKMIEVHKDTYYEPKDTSMKAGYCLFNTEVWNREFWGEDFIFCKRVHEAGFDIWVDPFIEFDHCGVRGVLTQVLTDKKENSK